MLKCKKCGSTNLGFMGNLTISAPIEYFNNLSKKALQKKEVRIWGFDWSKADIVCGDCFYSTLSERIVEQQHKEEIK